LERRATIGGTATYGMRLDHRESTHEAAPERRRAMSETPPAARTFDRAEVALILREAAQLDEHGGAAVPSAVPTESGADGLTLAEIERAAAEVGIARSAVATASLSVALRRAHVGTDRVHLVHEVAGELTRDACERLVSEIRTLAAPSDLRRTPDGLEFELGKPNGAPGSLLLQIRSTDGVTTIELWSHAPALTSGDIAGCGLLGIPAALFPVVATSGGQWPAIGAALALGTAGAAVGTGIGAIVRRRKLDRWRTQLESIVVPLTARVSELASEGGARLLGETARVPEP
jgi:hypothetical protein